MSPASSVEVESLWGQFAVCLPVNRGQSCSPLHQKRTTEEEEAPREIMCSSQFDFIRVRGKNIVYFLITLKIQVEILFNFLSDKVRSQSITAATVLQPCLFNSRSEFYFFFTFRALDLFRIELHWDDGCRWQLLMDVVTLTHRLQQFVHRWWNFIKTPDCSLLSILKHKCLIVCSDPWSSEYSSRHDM